MNLLQTPMKAIFLGTVLSLSLLACSSIPPSREEPKMVMKPDQSSVLETDRSRRLPVLTVMIAQNGEYYLQKHYIENGTEKESTLKVEGRDLASLKRSISQVIGNDAPMPVQIAADKDSRFQSYVSVLEVLRQLGFSEVSIKTQKDERLNQN